METISIVYLVAITFGVILAILWCCLPFAIFGTQPKIDKLIAEAQIANALLTEIAESLKPLRKK